MDAEGFGGVGDALLVSVVGFLNIELFEFFESFVAVSQPDDLPNRNFAVVGVIWPSKKFDELVAVSGTSSDASGSASLNTVSDDASRSAVEAKLDELKELFAEPQQQQLLEEAKALIPDLDNQASAPVLGQNPALRALTPRKGAFTLGFEVVTAR